MKPYPKEKYDLLIRKTKCLILNAYVESLWLYPLHNSKAEKLRIVVLRDLYSEFFPLSKFRYYKHIGEKNGRKT